MLVLRVPCSFYTITPCNGSARVVRPQHYPIVFGITFAAATDCRLNMGKTLEKQRKKAAKAAQEQAQNGVSAAGRDSRLAAIAKKLKYKLPTNPKKKVKLVPLISEALNAQAWDDAQTLLDMLQEQQDQAHEAALRLQQQQQQQSRLPGAAAAASTAHNPHHPPPEPEIPKLGSIMRWVRLADLAGTEATAAGLLASVLRVASGPQPGPKATAPDASGAAGAGAAAGGAVVLAQGHADRDAGYSPQEPTACTLPGTALPVRRFPPWRPPPPPDEQGPPQEPQEPQQEGFQEGPNGEQREEEGGGASAQSTAAAKRYGPYTGRFAVVPLPPEYAGTNANGSTAAALAPTATAPTTNGNGNGSNGGTAATLLPNLARDLTMYCTEPGTIRFEAGRRATRVEVPFVPGAFVLVGALSREECAQIVACAEEMGYAVDPDYTFSAAARAAAAGAGLAASSAARNGGSGGGERGAAGCVWLADESLQGPLYERVAPLLPQQLGGGELAGLNARWRLYRYDKGAVYRPHVDGAWPGSGLKDGRYEYDAFGDRWSRLTFLVYLNDGFEGGATTFYTPAPPGSGSCLEAHSVQPVCGNILVFPHGDTMGALVHEGSAVTRGSKYVIRSDVLYKLAPGQRGGGAGAPQPAMQLSGQQGQQRGGRGGSK